MKRYSLTIRPSMPSHLARDERNTLCGLPLGLLYPVPDDLAPSYRLCVHCERAESKRQAKAEATA